MIYTLLNILNKQISLGYRYYASIVYLITLYFTYYLIRSNYNSSLINIINPFNYSPFIWYVFLVLMCTLIFSLLDYITLYKNLENAYKSKKRNILKIKDMKYNIRWFILSINFNIFIMFSQTVLIYI